MEFSQKYVLIIRADSNDAALEEALHLVYLFLMRSLNEHRARGQNGEYELFGVELLAMLQRYRNLYTTPP